MKNCAIICEYNPFHTGHKYQLDCVRERDVDNIFCIMSGNFVQSGLPAFCDKSLRAECAVIGGADAVIELPTVYATASAQIFAEGAVKIISGIKDISYIAMGAVSDSTEIMRLADIKIKFNSRFNNMLKANLQCGKSYNMASIDALARLYSELYHEKQVDDSLFTDPNNILCIEYISAINKYCANVEPIITKRRGARHNDTDNIGEFISATAIRKAEADKEFISVKQYVPYKFDDIKLWRKEHAPNMQCYKSMAVYALKKTDTDSIKDLRNCSEGLEHLLKSLSDKYNFDSYISAVKTRRYGEKRIYRLFLDILLGINNNLTGKSFCTRLLSCKNGFDFTLLPECVKTTNSLIKTAAQNNKDINDVLNVDLNATALYNTICRIDGDYFNYSLIKV